MSRIIVLVATLVAFLTPILAAEHALASTKRHGATLDVAAGGHVHLSKPTPRKADRAPAPALAFVLPRMVFDRDALPGSISYATPHRAPTPTRARAHLMVFLN